jgi:hypothetical protein
MKADSVRAIFNAFDADGNGTLDKAEVLNALRMWDKSAKITPEYSTTTTSPHIPRIPTHIPVFGMALAQGHRRHVALVRHQQVRRVCRVVSCRACRVVRVVSCVSCCVLCRACSLVRGSRDGVIDYEEFSNLVLRQLRQDQASNMLYSD